MLSDPRLLCAVFADWVPPVDPLEQILKARLKPPIWDERGMSPFYLGTDRLGRDVLSNIIFGLGEGDETVLEGTKVLANMGAVVTLRALRRSEYNVAVLERVLGKLTPVSPERMLCLAREQKKIFKAYGLTPLRFKTMCHSCLSCDIVPFWDV